MVEWSVRKKIVFGIGLFTLISLVGLAMYGWWYVNDSPYTVYQVNNGTHIITVQKIVHNRDIAWTGIWGYMVFEAVMAVIIGALTLASILDDMDW